MITKVNELFLRRREERVKLLRAGFSGREIEALYLVLNSFEKQLEMSFRAKMLAGKLVQSENERLAEPCWNCGNGTGFVNSQFAVPGR
jgi:hypothetical protein